MTPGMKPSVRNMFEASEVAAAKAKQPGSKGFKQKTWEEPRQKLWDESQGNQEIKTIMPGTNI